MDKYLLDYCKNNPDLEVQDVFKYIYQASFGPEHLIMDGEKTLSYLKEEMDLANLDDLPEIEYLNAKYCRVHLKAIKKEDVEKFNTIFIKSAKVNKYGKQEFIKLLDEFKNYCQIGLTHFDINKVNTLIDEWEKNNFPPVHHSDSFREKHHPSYRLIKTIYLNKIIEK